jgi:hypothetical protein
VAITDIIDGLVTVYENYFNKSAGDLWIKRITSTVPEAVTEWPWMYFVLEDGDVALMTFAADVAKTRRRAQSLTVFGADTGETVRRPKVDVTHRFKAQLLVRPRRDLLEDETLVRPFIQPMSTVTAEHLNLSGALGDGEYCKMTGYRYGKFELGRLNERAEEFIGVEFSYEAKEIV